MVRYWMSLWLGVGGAIGFAMPINAQSNIVADPTVGTRVTPNFFGLPIEAIQGGTERGQNLFHSFQEFNISPDQSAFFLIPNNTIQNVFARVTGKNLSQIDGTLGTRLDGTFTTSTANLFLMNPNGIIFGRGGRLDVGGSFVATTANAIGFGTAGEFSTINPQQPGALLTVDPSAFIFASLQKPGSIMVQSQATRSVLENETSGLQVPNGQGLSLLGGDVKVDGGQLNAWGGRIELGAVIGREIVELNRNDRNIIPAEISRGSVVFNNNANADVSFMDGGNLSVIAGDIQLLGESKLLAGIAPGLGGVGSRAGKLKISSTGIVRVAQGSRISNDISTNAIGSGGDLEILAESLEVTNGSQLSASTFGTGDAGNIIIKVTDYILFQGIRSDGEFSSAAFSNVESTGVGKGGLIDLYANKILVLNDALIASFTNGTGDSGKIKINTDVLELNEGDIFTNVLGLGVGKGGSTNIKTQFLSFKNGGQIGSSTFGKGDAGSVEIDAKDILVDGGFDNFRSGIFNNVEENGIGTGGSININTDKIAFKSGGQIASSIFGEGNLGFTSIIAQDIFIDGGSDNFRSGFFNNVERTGKGKGGDIDIVTNRIYFTNGGQISAVTLGKGDSGNISINAKNTIDIYSIDNLSNRSSTARLKLPH